jgi:TolB-like protein
MPIEIKKEIELEIAHVLFIDIVGYSKLSVNEQHARIEELNEIVRLSEQFQNAEAANRILKIPTGDGMALVFYKSPEEPAQCAFEISRALKERPRLQIRMGIHSGPVTGVVDVNKRVNLAGAGINMAQRVMDCGDAGHILLSRHVAEDLAEYERWREFLHDIGTFEVKHGVPVSVTNLYSEEIGNPRLPSKLQAVRKHRAHVRWAEIAAALLVLGAIIAGVFFFARSPTTSALRVLDKSIAVLPFENRSEDKANAYFTDGVQDEILTDLAKIADLKVISRTSVLQYKSGVARNLRQIAQQLGVANVVEGSVQRSGNRVRVNAQLVDARTDAHLWAQTYDRDLADIFAIQTEIATKIVDQLRAKISPSEKNAIETPPTRDLTAYDLFIRAQALSIDLTNQSVVKEKAPQAIRLLEEAVARDPNFTRAFCLLSRIQGVMFWAGFDHTPGRLALAKEAAEAALRTAPEDGDAHLAMADYYYHGFRDYQQARKELDAARQTLPNNPQVLEYSAYIERRQGDWASATRDFERSIELDPRNFHTIQQLALTYQLQHRYADQLRALDRVLTIVPDDLSTLVLRAWVPADWRADLRPFQQLRANLMEKDPAAANDIEDINYALCERTPEAISRTLAAYPTDGNVYNGIKYPRAYWEGVIAVGEAKEKTHRWRSPMRDGRLKMLLKSSQISPLH